MTAARFDPVGAWRLAAWLEQRDGVSRTLPASGVLIYSADGWMSALLTRNDSDPAQPLAYAARLRLEGAQVHHDVVEASLPGWTGRALVRRILRADAGHLHLETPEEISRSGRRFVHVLEWQRASGAR